MRGRGRGGQRRNKVETAIRLRLPDGTTVTRTSGRSQAGNLASARAELARKLTDRAGQAAARAENRQRHDQAAAGTAFTHNMPRGLVIQHSTGRTWPVRAWQQGRLG